MTHNTVVSNNAELLKYLCNLSGADTIYKHTNPSEGSMTWIFTKDSQEYRHTFSALATQLTARHTLIQDACDKARDAFEQRKQES